VQVRLEQMPPAPVFEYRAQAQDADGDVLAYSLLSGPAGATIDPSSGLLRWQAQAGQYEFVIRVEDGRGGSAEQRFTLSVGTSTSMPKRAAPAPLIDWDRQAIGPLYPDALGWRSAFLLDSASDEAEGSPNGKLRVTLPLRAQLARTT
jgi:hypothetical protein